MKLEDITLFLASVFLVGCITYVLTQPAEGGTISNPYERPPLIQPPEETIRQCPSTSDNPFGTYVHPWVRDCYNSSDPEPQEVECSMNQWAIGSQYARGGRKEKECA